MTLFFVFENFFPLLIVHIDQLVRIEGNDGRIIITALKDPQLRLEQRLEPFDTRPHVCAMPSKNAQEII